MSDATDTPAAETQTVPVRLLGQFIKDLSFEVPGAPEIYAHLRENPPEIPISIDTSMRHVAGGTYEVLLNAQVEATSGGKTAFILEISYGCVVEIDEKVVPNEAIHPLLMIEIPRQLFPFVRQLIADMTIGGGFPPLLMQMIDFGELYQRKFGVAARPVEMQAPEGAAIN